jgi:hypothetical protein
MPKKTAQIRSSRTVQTRNLLRKMTQIWILSRMICSQSHYHKNLKEGPMKKNAGIVDISLSGPFCNENSGFTHWSIGYGNLNDAWMLKASFMSAYDRTILTSLQFKPKDILHTRSYYDFNIRSMEFGEASRWKRTKKTGRKTGTVSWVYFVFRCKISDEASGLTCLRRILDKVA